MTDAGGGTRSPTSAEVLRQAIEYYLQDTHTMLPGKVEAYNPSDQRATIKPLIKRRLMAQDGSELEEELPILPDVPIMFPRIGKFIMTLPVEVGDFVMVLFCERSIDNYLAGDGEDTDPDEFRMHDITDAVALPGFTPFSRATARADASDMVMGHESGLGVAFFKENEVHFGAKMAADALALASKVKTELDAVKADQVNLKGLLTTHVHSAVTPGPPVSVSGPPAPPGFSGYNPHTPSTVDSDIVKSDG